MDAIPYDPRLSRNVTGNALVTEARLEQVLGPTAYLTWMILCGHRDAMGMTTITMKGMRTTKRFQTLSHDQIKTALERLRKAGLVRDLVRRRIRMDRPVGRQGATANVWAYPRRIFGCRCASPTVPLVMVPGWVSSWMKTAKTRGGARIGAGRKPKRTLVLGNTPKTNVGFGKSVGGTWMPPGRIINQSAPYLIKSKCPPDIYNTITSGFGVLEVVTSFASQRKKQSVASNAPFPILKVKTIEPASQENVGFGSNPASTQGSRVGSSIPTARRRPPPPPGKQGVPPYPCRRVCPPAIVPTPPQLPDSITGLDAAEWLAKAYRGAVEAKYKKRVWACSNRKKIQKSKYLEKLKEAAELLRQHGVPPVSWAIFSTELWHDKDMGKGPPPIKWVYDLDRIEKHHGWGRREGYLPKRAVYSQTAQDMLRRYKCMREALAQAGAQTRQEVAAVVQQWFPGDAYKQLHYKAVAMAIEDQKLINERVRRGDWVW